MCVRTSALLALFLLLAAVAGAQPPANGDWKLDAVHLKDGRTVRGLLVKEAADGISLRVIRRLPGRPTVHFLTTLPTAAVQKLDKLSAKEREELAARIQRLCLADQGEDQRLRGLELKPAFLQVIGFERKKALSYFSDHFELTSNASEAIVRRAALQLEQMYAAYAHFFPPVNRAARTNATTTIILFQSVAEYQATLKGRNIFNPAFYDAGSNEVYAAAELQQLGRRLEELRRQQADEWDRLQKHEADILKLPRGEIQELARKQVQEAKRELQETAVRNEELLRAAARPLFHTLYHETWHAYLANFVFPPDRGEVPRWLNEGLAQLFETAIVEGNEVQVGWVDPARLTLVQGQAARGELLPLADLLKAGPSPFVLAHGRDRQAAERYYLASWALVHYLMFGRRVLDGTSLQAYLTSLNGKIDPRTGSREKPADPLDALPKLAGLPLPELEKEWQQYILGLRPEAKGS